MIDPVDNPAFYKFGVLYYNKDDFRMIVPKKDRMLGWTLNFAHRTNVISFFILLVIILWMIIK